MEARETFLFIFFHKRVACVYCYVLTDFFFLYTRVGYFCVFHQPPHTFFFFTWDPYPQVEIAEEAREAFRRSRMTGTGPHGPLLATTPGIMAIPTWDTYTPMVVKGGGREAAPWARTPDMDRAGGECCCFLARLLLLFCCQRRLGQSGYLKVLSGDQNIFKFEIQEQCATSVAFVVLLSASVGPVRLFEGTERRPDFFFDVKATTTL